MQQKDNHTWCVNYYRELVSERVVDAGAFVLDCLEIRSRAAITQTSWRPRRFLKTGLVTMLCEDVIFPFTISFPQSCSNVEQAFDSFLQPGVFKISLTSIEKLR
jgi:hypothetical protein